MRNPAGLIRPALMALTLLAAVEVDQATAQSGYMFREPMATVSLRFGVGGPNANDDLFNFLTNELTLEKGDFRAFALGGDVAIRLASQFDVVLAVSMDNSSNRSEFRDWEDQDDQPIEQNTDVLRVPITLGAKYYLVPRGRRLSRHTWVPSSLTPYVTAGAGYMAYRVVQDGDFVDFETLDVFSSYFESAGGGATAYAGAGADYWFSSRVGLTADGRYAWASADLNRNFAEFDSIDLQGLQFTAGLAVRF